MLLILCIAVLAVFDTTYAGCSKSRNSPPACGNNEVYTNCTSYCPVTCAHLTGGAPASCIAGCKGEGCECVDGTARNDQGQCVDYSECPGYNPCPRRNEHYEKCGSSCTVTCDNMNMQPMACAEQCKSGCRCDDGYVRNANGICVKPGACPRARRQQKVDTNGANGPRGCIDPNEHYEDCGASCTVTCDNMNGEPYACTQECLAGCRCDDGYVRDGNRGCIKPEQCFRAQSRKQIACGNNEVYSNCTSYCPVTCAHLTGGAPASCAQGCKGEGCECVDGTARNDQGQCVDYSECPGYNPCPRRNEHYEKCGSSCTVTCDNMNMQPMACTEQCKSGCRCDDGYVRNGNGICVKPGACPRARRQQKASSGGPGGPYCRGKNEHPADCGGSCPVTCDNMDMQGMACAGQCIPGCRCDDGYVRNSNGKCIRPENCP